LITVAVIIPYFQTRAGILRRALNSVLAQTLPPDVQANVIVVDDGSPVPAQGETVGLSFSTTYQLTLIHQPNGGVSAARNTGLRQVDERTDYVAFLDSDDIWQPGYLAHAITTLEHGYDFYFCDTQRLGSPRSVFASTDFDLLLSSSSGAVNIGSDTFALDKDRLFDESLRGRAFMIQAMVYRRAVAPGLTFDTSLRVAGEDTVFLFQLLGRCRRPACSTQLMVTLADGVNINASKRKYGWDNPEHLVLCFGELLACYSLDRNLCLSGGNKAFLNRRVRNLRMLFAYLTIRSVFKYGRLWSRELITMITVDKKFWIWYPIYVVYAIMRYSIPSMNYFDKLDGPAAAARESRYLHGAPRFPPMP
jgi:succinoglycan biosynthesis protein ExoW